MKVIYSIKARSQQICGKAYWRVLKTDTQNIYFHAHKSLIFTATLQKGTLVIFFSVILYKIKAYLVKPQKNQHQKEEKANLFPED